MLPCLATLPTPAPEGDASARGGGPVIDVHCHLMTPQATELVAAHYPPDDLLANEPYDLYAGEPSRARNRELAPTLLPKLRDTAPRLRDMDAMGVDIQVLSSFVSQNFYWTDASLGSAVARVQNERLAEAADEHPDRFVALGTLPMQDPASAVTELEYAIQTLGFKVVQISTNIDGRDLDDPRFEPFWRRAEELDAVVLLHPSGFTEARRLDDWFLTNLIGNPLDSTVALSRLILSGCLSRHPRLQLLVVHGGGYTPFYWARLDHGWRARPEVRANLVEPPSQVLQRVYFDTMVFDPGLLRNLVTFAGPDHVLLGTDYPFDMGEEDPVGLIGAVPGLSDADRSALRGGNAARLFGIA